MKNNKSYPTKNQSVMCVCVKSYIQYIWIYIPFSFDYFEKIFLFFSSPTTTILLLLAVKSTFYSRYFFHCWMNEWMDSCLVINYHHHQDFFWLIFWRCQCVCVCVCRLACHLSSSSYSIFVVVVVVEKDSISLI